jgi:AraC-like DNA-binding protein
MGVRPAASVDDFLAHPVGRYVVGPTFLVWCYSDELTGSTLWGTPGSADLSLLFRLWELYRYLPTRKLRVVTDGRLFDKFSPELLESVLDFVRTRAADLFERLERQAFILPPTLAGAAMIGLYPMAGLQHAWRAFEDAPGAFAWASPAEGPAAEPVVTALVASARAEPPLVGALRRHLRGDVCTTIDAAARALGRSTRTLQRELREAGTSFRGEAERIKVEIARQLLDDTDEKLEIVGQRIGCNSPSSFSRLFRRHTGVSPSAFRARVSENRKT